MHLLDFGNTFVEPLNVMSEIMTQSRAYLYNILIDREAQTSKNCNPNLSYVIHTYKQTCPKSIMMSPLRIMHLFPFQFSSFQINSSRILLVTSDAH